MVYGSLYPILFFFCWCYPFGCSIFLYKWLTSRICGPDFRLLKKKNRAPTFQRKERFVSTNLLQSFSWRELWTPRPLLECLNPFGNQSVSSKSEMLEECNGIWVWGSYGPWKGIGVRTLVLWQKFGCFLACCGYRICPYVGLHFCHLLGAVA